MENITTIKTLVEQNKQNIQLTNIKGGYKYFSENDDNDLKEKLKNIIERYRAELYKGFKIETILKDLNEKYWYLMNDINQENLKRLEDALENEMEALKLSREIKDEKRKEIYFSSRLTQEEIKYNFSKAIVKTQEEKEFFNIFKKYVEKFEKIKKEGFGLLFSGLAGTGKTFYSLTIANELFAKGYTIKKINVTDLLNEIKKTYTDNTKKSEEQIFKEILKVDLLVIDDLGNDKLSDWVIEKLFILFDELYKYKKSFIITTNLTGEQLEKYLSLNGSNKISSRIKARCKLFLFNWEDRRLDNKNKFDEILNN